MSSLDLFITGGRVHINGTFQDASLGIRDGSITHIVSNETSIAADQTLVLDGEYVIPGLVDGHIHFREPGYEEKEGVKSGSAAAAAGGITTVVEMPNTTPPVLTVERLEEKRELFREKSCVDYALFGALTEENIDTGDIQALADSGVTAFKTFMSTSFGPLLMDNKGLLLRAFEEVAKTSRPLYIHAEDQEYLDEFGRRVSDDDGLDAFFASRPPIAETTAIADVIELVRETRAETVIPHVTTARGLDLITRAREEGLPIFAELTPYHLAVDSDRLEDVGTPGIGTPPVRDPENRCQLIDRFASGRVQLLGSDHAPHTLAEKQAPPLEVAPGMPQLETALPVLADMAGDGRIPLSMIVECYSRAPAKLHGLYPKKGSLRVGTDADLVVLDPHAQITVDPSTFESKAAYSPFDGRTFAGTPTKVFQRGELIADNQTCLATYGDGTDQRRIEP